MSRSPVSSYLLSVPERVLRSATALAGGLLRELGDVALPPFVRRTRLYQTLVDSTLRFLIEQVGQVEGAYPSESRLAEDFLLRRTAGNGLELIGILSFRASPVWVMAALADVSGAGRQLIAEIAGALKKEGMLPPDAEVSTVEQMLDGLERTAGRVAEAVNTPPLDVKALREEWAEIRREAASIPAPNLPSADDVWRAWRQLADEAERQKRSVWELSSLMALGAVTRLPDNLRWLGKSATLAAKRTGEVFAGALLNHYRDSLREIHETGYVRYLIREYRPYLRAAALQFSPKRRSLTERWLRRNVVLLCCALLANGLAQAQSAAAKPKVAPAKRSGIVSRVPAVSGDALKGHVSFLASDALAGRNTPSHELDIAAEYIASQFRRIGLEPPSQTGYFQVSEAETTIRMPDSRLSIAPNDVSGSLPPVIQARVVKVSSMEGLTRQHTAGRAVITTPDIAKQIVERRRELQPQVILSVEDTATSPIEGVVTVRNAEVGQLFAKLPEGSTAAVFTNIAAGLKNVIGVLRGANPKLREQYVIVSAHYDHVGTQTRGEGDRIYNGANDNASGVAGMIEAAASLLSAKQKPRRSIAFIAFWGEEKGLIGSRYYAAKPVFPIAQTVAQINLEQLGRTDDSEGPRVNAAVVTGYRFSEVGSIVSSAAATVGIKIQDLPKADEFFDRSDNEALAAVGVPAHTIGIAFMFPDYHSPGDEWQKIDYANMAKVTRAIAASALAVANRAAPPRWLKVNPKAERFSKVATPLSKPREVSGPKSGNSPTSPKPPPPTPSPR